MSHRIARRSARGVIAFALAGVTLLSMPNPAEAAPGVSAYDGRVSYGAFWTESNGTAGPLGMSDDGRYILYYTYANNVADEDLYRQADVYWYDMVWGINLLVSYSATTWLAGDGTIGDILHRDRMVSPDGRYVMFSSSSTDLVSGDTNGATDVFVGDMYGFGLTTRVSLNNGNQIPGESLALGMSNDALKVLFATEVSLTATDTNETWDVYLYDRTTGVNKTKLVSANVAGSAVGSTLGVISETGRYVAFLTEGALNAADTNLENDVYLKDLSTPTAAPKFVSVGMGGAMPEGIVGHLTMTPDAKFVAFDSNAANLVSGDTNGTVDVFVRNMVTNAVVRASTGAGFAQHPEPLCDSFSLSGDGRYLAMSCEGSGLVPSDTNEISDVFSKDLSTGAITLISRAANGAAGNDVSGGPMISRDGTWITFGSFSSNLIPYDANAAGDVFRATRQ
jgi:Tol biopolymer transport system component